MDVKKQKCGEQHTAERTGHGKSLIVGFLRQYEHKTVSILPCLADQIAILIACNDHMGYSFRILLHNPVCAYTFRAVAGTSKGHKYRFYISFNHFLRIRHDICCRHRFNPDIRAAFYMAFDNLSNIIRASCPGKKNPGFAVHICLQKICDTLSVLFYQPVNLLPESRLLNNFLCRMMSVQLFQILHLISQYHTDPPSYVPSPFLSYFASSPMTSSKFSAVTMTAPKGYTP